MIIGSSHRTDSSSKKKTIQRKDISSPKSIQFPVVQVKKFSSPPPSPLNTTPKPHGCSPLGYNPFFEPSASAEPQPPSPCIVPRAPLNNTETTPSYFTSPKATTTQTSDDLIEVSLQEQESYANSPKHCGSGVPASFIGQIDALCADFTTGSLTNPVDGSGVDEEPDQFVADYTRNSDTSKFYSLSSEPGRFDPKRETWQVIGRAGGGPYRDNSYSTADTFVQREPQDRHIFSNHTRTPELPPSDMVERHRAQNIQDLALYFYAFITSAIAITALILAALAICQIKSLQVPPGILLLGSVPIASSVTSSGIHPRVHHFHTETNT
jgi:hypothetical protein